MSGTMTVIDARSIVDLKGQLADCLRMLEKGDVIDYNGHCSTRIADDRILINIGSCQRSLATADDICTIDMEGNLIEGRAKPPLEFHLHTGIYRARPDVRAIVHAHPRWSTFLTMVGEPYRPVYAQGSIIYPVPLLDTPNAINNPTIADRLAATLGTGSAALMKSHGAVTVGADIVEAFVLAVYMEENAMRQHMAMQIGKPYEFSEGERKVAKDKLWTQSLFQRTWDHYRAKLGDAGMQAPQPIAATINS